MAFRPYLGLEKGESCRIRRTGDDRARKLLAGRRPAPSCRRDAAAYAIAAGRPVAELGRSGREGVRGLSRERSRPAPTWCDPAKGGALQLERLYGSASCLELLQPAQGEDNVRIGPDRQPRMDERTSSARYRGDPPRPCMLGCSVASQAARWRAIRLHWISH